MKKWAVVSVFFMTGLVVGLLFHFNTPETLTFAKQTFKLWPEALEKFKKKENTDVLDKTVELEHQETHFSKTAVPLTTQEQAKVALRRAIDFIEAGEKVEGEILLIESVHRYPKNSELRLKLAELYLDSDRDQEAERVLSEGLRFHNQKPEYILELSEIYQRQGHAERALSLLLSMPKAHQSKRDYVAILASSYYQAGLYEKAKAQYSRLLKYNQNNSRWWLGLALSAEATGDLKAAQSGYQKVQQYSDLEQDVLIFVRNKVDHLSGRSIKTAHQKME